MKRGRVLDPELSPVIKNFVRGELGCTCPDAVFEKITVECDPRQFKGLPGDILIAIGERLLVLLIETGHCHALTGDFARLVRRAQALRDAEGFNRVRLVVATPDIAVADAVLRDRFSALPFLDDRTHLHIITPQGLPALPAGAAQRMPGP